MILECENLSKNYGSLKALDELNLKLESGKIVGLLGPNGLKGKVPVPLTDEEVEKLKKSADALKSVIAQIEL